MQEKGTARQYNKNYKEQAVKLASEKGCKAASKELGIPYDTLYGWIKAARRGELHLEGRDRSIEENQRLRQANKELAKENKRLQEEKEFLAGATALYAVSRQKSAKKKE